VEQDQIKVRLGPDAALWWCGGTDANRQAKKGGFKDCLPEDLLTAVLKESVKRSGVDPAKIG
jgi:acetyl-CoA acetyltransferase